MSLPDTVRAVHITGPDAFEIVAKPRPDVLHGMSLAATVAPCSLLPIRVARR